MTLFTSDKSTINNILFSLFATVFFAGFGAIYEHFGHGVYSNYMIYAFIFPLMLCLLPYVIMLVKNVKLKKITARWWNLTVLTITLCSVIKGILQIYGTTNKLIYVYCLFSAITFLITVVCFFLEKPDRNE